MNQAPPERLNELQAAFLTLTNTQTQFMTETRSSIRNLETQVGQLTNMLNNRPHGNFPSNIEVNPKEQVQAITLRSGKQTEHPRSPQAVVQDGEMGEQSDPEKVTEDHQLSEKSPPVVNEQPVREILSKKRKMEDYETVALTEECSAILQRKLPQKLRDPGSFTIPCTIGNFESMNALCDLGASINLMLLSVFRRLKLGEARPTTVTLQLADISIAHPRGIIEDVLVKVDKFIFPADFIVLDMEEDANAPIILGRPFLATGRALIDVQKGELRVDVVNDCQDSIGKKKKKTKERFRTVRRRMKRLLCGKFEGFDDIGDNFNILNSGREFSSYDTMALKDARGGLDPS
ncbi:uncharacterized protein LOC133785625 [Humulus lupulus]|uniref:uncharacterized protein LOC133785625 n=1 Tax=Humulus lupulus TaxID=3486 RepID=UPI002B40D36E|nr:uncharacterized protein LOC133785625 [Humulus lupulus]